MVHSKTFISNVTISFTKLPQPFDADVALVAAVLVLERVEQLVVVGQRVHELQILVRLCRRDQSPEQIHLVRRQETVFIRQRRSDGIS